MPTIDDILNKIDILHGETQEDIAKIEEKIIKMDKKVDIHIKVAEAMDKRDIESKFTRNQKIAMLAILVPVVLTGVALIFH